MAKLPNHVLVETAYRGHSVAAVLGPRGAVCIDAPLFPSQTDAWVRRLQERGASQVAFSVQLDSSPDRALAMAHLQAVVAPSSVPVIASQQTSEAVRAMPDSLRDNPILAAMEGQTFDSQLVASQWTRPQVAISEGLTLYWGDARVEVLRVPSVSMGSVWVHLPQEQILFVGDSVATQLPPYLGEADFEVWLEALARLRRAPFRECRVFCSRSGWITSADISRFGTFVRAARKRHANLAAKKKADLPKELGRAANSLVGPFGVPSDQRALALARVRLGLQALWEREHGPLAERPQPA